MLPTDVSSSEGEAAYGTRVMIISILWIVVTVLVGVLLVILAPALTGVY